MTIKKRRGLTIARLASAFFLSLAALVPGVGDAETPAPVVVELYTSQGCSSCPPADALMHDLADRDNVIALALHVDYWDYIGWTDAFARPEHTVRQKAYARAAGERMIYTPQMIVSGLDHVVGVNAMKVMGAILDRAELAATVNATLVRDGARLALSAEPPVGAEPLRVQLIRYRPTATVEILRGENAGRTLSYANIVTEWDDVAEWDGTEPLSMTFEVSGDQPAVVIFQRPGHGAIVGAAAAR